MTRSGRTDTEVRATRDDAVRPASDASFSSALATFKRDGCLLLVTGEVAPPVRARASRKLLGTPTRYRERIVAAVDPAVPDPIAHLPGALDSTSDGVTVIDRRAAPPVPPTVVCDAILDAFPAESANAGTLRFALATLTPYLDDLDPTRSLLDHLRDAAHDAGAIGAVHLPLADRSETVADLTAHVDARIELRSPTDTIPEQRWYLPPHDETTNWVTM